ncbi:type I secretion system permease/ATPase [uncultured Roseobacter sp.]|uniref:type I secretion system permease/ATPase n=1 Tax=uncultured Roseobacter sp. TaxID=114847 RepID=UPI00260EDC1A|nr:type I secretion system permease/ATPase [uncultured Roseobacter sp.]
MAETKSEGLPELRRARNAGMTLLGAVFVFSVFVNLLMLTGPLFMLQVYDRVLGSRSEETLAALFLLVAALYGLMMLLDYARGRVLARFGGRFQAALDQRVFDAVLKRAVSPQERAAPARGLRDLETLRTLFTSPVAIALFDIPWTPLFLAAIFVFHPWLGWLATGGAALLVTVTLLNNWLTRARTLQAQGASSEAQNFADQARRAAELIRAQGMRSSVSTRWGGMRDEAMLTSLGASDRSGFFTAISKSATLFLQSAMLALGAYLVLQAEVTAGAMIAGSIMLGRALSPVQQALGQWSMVLQARAAWSALGELLSKTPAEPETIALPRPHANISFAGVTVASAPAKPPVLHGVSFYLGEGEALGVIGKSGSGKTTLAKTLLGLTPVAVGEVRIGGATIDQYDPDTLGSYIGYLPQDVVLFTGTVAENIARMSVAPDDEKVVEAARRANAHEMILSLPKGYKTVVHGVDGYLSGGQRQRIALARAFYGDPVLLILDEPNSALDSEGSEALNRAVKAFKAEGKAVVITTHRPTAISECDRLLVLQGGRVRADGSRDEVLKSMVGNVEDIRQKITREKSG